MKILIVEDEIKLAEHLKRWLKQNGYIVDILTDGEKALDYILLNDKTLDLILLDQMLPTKQGTEICEIVRDNKINIPILMLTAKDLENDIILGLTKGADDYLTKPFSLSVLLARIQALLRRSKVNLHLINEVKVGNLVLNQATHKIFYNQKELQLTLKEYNLLEYFMKHPNTAIERDELLEKVWDSNFDSFSNVVDVQITRLRKKLKEINATLIVETIRGVGFILRA